MLASEIVSPTAECRKYDAVGRFLTLSSDPSSGAASPAITGSKFICTLLAPSSSVPSSCPPRPFYSPPSRFRSPVREEVHAFYINPAMSSSASPSDSINSVAPHRPDSHSQSPVRSPVQRPAIPQWHAHSGPQQHSPASTDSPRHPTSSVEDDSTKIQLPSIFNSTDSHFRNDQRRVSVPTLHPEALARQRQSAIALSRTPPSTNIPSALASYQFPNQSSAFVDDVNRSTRTRLGSDSQLDPSFGDSSLLHNDHTLSGATQSASSSSFPSVSSAPYSTPLSSDYALSRSGHALPSVQYGDSDQWSPASNTSSLSLPGVNRPTSSPGSSLSFKYDDSIRHSSLSGSYNFPTDAHPQTSMYGNAARISGHSDRRASYAQSAPDSVKDEWGFSQPDFLLPSAGQDSGGGTPSPSRSPSGGPAPTPPTVERPPQKKRGKLPKPTTDFLKDWLHRHSDHPYPSEEEKKQLCAATGLSMSQVSNWMINVRPHCSPSSIPIEASLIYIFLDRPDGAFSHRLSVHRPDLRAHIPFPHSAGLFPIHLSLLARCFLETVVEHRCRPIIFRCTPPCLSNHSPNLSRVLWDRILTHLRIISAISS